jgi:hypothetical protein
MVTFNQWFSIALLIAKIAPSLRAQLLLDIPLFTSQKSIELSVLMLTTIKNHTKTTVNYLAPANTSTVMDGYPGCTTKTITYHVLDCHISGKTRSVILEVSL